MSVYTSVTDHEMIEFLKNYEIGEFIALKGIAGGITNTNYFVDTTHGRFVLTLFETLKLEELPFYLHLTDFLNRQGIACPAPIAQKNGQFSDLLCQKPATIMSCLNGADITQPNEKQCFAVGAMLAKMHLASQQFSMTMENPRYTTWWANAAEKLRPFLTDDENCLLHNEIEFLKQHNIEHLPSGIIHADLFKDNVLMYYDDVAGFIDFYYACNGVFIYDLGIAINDWARNHSGEISVKLKSGIMAGYESIRPLEQAEKDLFLVAQRAAAIRFWVSRLLDFHFPTPGELTFIKDPDVFKQLLLSLRQQTL